MKRPVVESFVLFIYPPILTFSSSQTMEISLLVIISFPLSVESHCVDKEGKEYAEGEQWKEGCEDCECSNGIPSCKLIPCALFMPPEGTQCKVRPGTENDCCPQFDCEEGKLFCFALN